MIPPFDQRMRLIPRQSITLWIRGTGLYICEDSLFYTPSTHFPTVFSDLRFLLCVISSYLVVAKKVSNNNKPILYNEFPSKSRYNERIQKSRFFCAHTSELRYNEKNCVSSDSIYRDSAILCQSRHLNIACISIPGKRETRKLLFWSGYRPITFTRMFEPRHNILSDVRTNFRKYVVTWLEHSRENNRRYPDHT